MLRPDNGFILNSPVPEPATVSSASLRPSSECDNSFVKSLVVGNESVSMRSKGSCCMFVVADGAIVVGGGGVTEEVDDSDEAFDEVRDLLSTSLVLFDL